MDGEEVVDDNEAGQEQPEKPEGAADDQIGTVTIDEIMDDQEEKEPEQVDFVDIDKKSEEDED